ncbi:Beta-xylosidase [Candidatus Rhodobacter oscarellae]|uniref:Beta-xylosidase n=1 Tax=Candidatus Rhodobacter oscarellae TaxID=1675527 RepID=A0A0J9ECC2_9RHOB|nr:glycoside hydrolase family 43 protein [Candidatus Rhodobacter lobularis]KMW60291.1 Beta-xylosidase [Candidatus Rhodobacter lobularis]
MIRNPILPGFNPDPSICRVGEDYYIATSTFEWYPGVQIHHSRDLVNWTLVARPLNRATQLDMRGNPDSGGVWAPCLSHADGKFWLVFTDMKRIDVSFKDSHNYIVTCETIDGEWSDPWYVNSSGFDPSLFHDEDGRKWFMNMRWNHRGPGTGGNAAHAAFDGILLQEWSPEAGLFGPITNIYDGSPRGLTEAPHIFKRNGWYYLTVAEGGTGYGHAVTMARAKEITGPYETQPDGHLLCAADAPDHAIQRTGHGQYVETPDGQAYHTFLMGRPLPGRFCPLGRETGIERCVWGEDDWLYLEQGGMLAREALPGLADAEPAPTVASEHDFRDGLPPEFQWLRTPYPDRLFTTGPEGLTLFGRESLGSPFEQSLLARRQEHLVYSVETRLHSAPETYQHAAGLTAYYNAHKFHALALSCEADGGRALTILSCAGDWPDGAVTRYPEAPVAVPDGPVELRVAVDHAELQFFWRVPGGDWQPIGPVLSNAILSDEGGRGAHASFTGCFVGMFAFDLTGGGASAVFDRFVYAPKP